MNFKKQTQENIFFEELHIRHIKLILDLENNIFKNSLYEFAITNTFDELKTFIRESDLNKKKCIIAIKQKKLVGYILTYPINNKKTCIKIDKPIILTSSESISERFLILELIRKAINITDSKTSSWLIESRVENSELISCTRELGFQPLKETNIWSKHENTPRINNGNKTDTTSDYYPITKFNAKKVLNFILSNESILLRNIMDMHQEDILRRRDKISGVLMNDNEIILAIIKNIGFKDINYYTLTRGICWDERINNSLELILNNINIDQNIFFRINAKDKEINSFFKKQNFNHVHTELTLARNTLLKNELRSTNKINQSLESILERINPSGNTFPAPYPAKLK